MTNPLKDPKKNPLKIIYEEFWVPIFGRLLYLFRAIIAGEPQKTKHPFNLRDKEDAK